MRADQTITNSTMKILVLNCGSSSIKAAVLEMPKGEVILEALVERITQAPEGRFSDGTVLSNLPTGHEAALRTLLNAIIEKLPNEKLVGIGHRVVHGGEFFDRATRITPEVIEKITSLNELAPLHNPVNLKGITVAQDVFPDLLQVAVFDTAFHHTLPKRAKLYALPTELMEKHGIRRYGFHGTSHEYVSKRAAEVLERDLRDLRLISCHLGSGCSMAAIEYGRSVETSMGMTPLEGLVMGTRPGDLDPGILLYLKEKEGLNIEEITEILNKDSGLKGLSGHSNDMRDILKLAGQGHEHARMAIQVFTHRVRKYIGAYAALMGGLDGIIFTGGIGENSPTIRNRICQRLQFLGAIIDEDYNHDATLQSSDAQVFSTENSRVKLLAIRTDEQKMIALKVFKLCEEMDAVNPLPKIPIAISARHVHLTQEAVDQLFGEGHELTVKKWLTQPGQFAANETVTLVGPKNTIEHVRILGPCRSLNQVEISRTDEFTLGIDAPIRESGKVENTPGIKIIGPTGTLNLQDGVICAWRHIHMTPEDAALFGVKDRDVVDVEFQNGFRSLTFGNVLIRVSPKYKLEMHIDTDEGNAAEIQRGAEGVLQAITSTGVLQKKAN